MNVRLIVAGLAGALGVGFAAFGAHALPAEMPDPLRNAWETGARLHLVHGAALAALALAPRSPWLAAAFAVLLAGVIVFSGSLYAYALTAWRPLALATPVGGVALIAGWLVLAAAGLRAAQKS